MINRLAVVVVASTLGLGACTTAGNTPATAPTVTQASVTTRTAATSMTSAPEPTTTLDRITEIQAIFQDLEVRRLQAIMDDDEEAFRAVFANEEYGERSLGAIERTNVIDPGVSAFTVFDVFVDEASCIAVHGLKDTAGAIEGGGAGDSADYIVEFSNGTWGMSRVGSGWRCEGPHPFSD